MKNQTHPLLETRCHGHGQFRSFLSRALSLTFGLGLASVLCAQRPALQHVLVRKPPPGRGFMAPNNGGIWSWGDEILVMYVNGAHKNGTGCGSHSTQEGAPGTTYDTSRSLDGGVTWGDHRIAFKRYTARCGWPNPQPVRLTKPLNFRNPDTIVHFQRDDAGKTYLYVSTDRGRNWSGPYNNIPRFRNGVSGRTNYEVTGPLSLTAYMEMADTSVPGCSRYPSHAVRTTDGGLTWRLGPEISSLTPCGQGKRVEWDTHPSVARIDADTLIASFRSGNQGDKTWTRTGWFDVTRSTDGGKTWSHLIRLGESPGNNSCPTSTQVVVLPNGKKRVVTLMWLRPPDKKSCERSRLLARFSDDKGDTWSHTIPLRDDAFGWDTGYPIATVRADGKIVVCYWMKTVDQNEPNYIAATIWDAADQHNNKKGISVGEHSADITRIQVNPDRVIARRVHRKLGICLNFTMDRNSQSLHQALKKLGVSAIRFQEGEFGDNWHFDPDDPARPVLGVADPKVWYLRSKTDGQRWKSTLTPAGFLELATTQQLEAYSIVGIDALVYDGNSPHLSHADVVASACEFVQFARKAADRNRRTDPIIRYWEIGNENDLQGMLGKFKLGHSWKATQYAQVAAELAVHMKHADPRARIGVNGMTPKSDWWRDVLTAEVEVNGQTRRLSDLIDFLVTHQYSWVSDYAQWRDAGSNWKYAQNVTAAVDAAKRFAPGKLIAVTECSAYSPGRKANMDQFNNAWHAIHNLQMLGEILKHEPVTHACFWVTQWSSKASSLHNALTADGKLTPVGESLRFWNEFAQPNLVDATHSGKICVYATSDSETGKMAVFLLNRSDHQKTVELSITNAGRINIARIDRLCAVRDDPMAMEVERRSGTNPRSSNGGVSAVELPPVSATVVSLE